MPAIEKQRPALFCVAKRGMAALVSQVIGLGFDDPCGQPQVAMPMADDLAQQGFGQGLGVSVEEAVGQGAGRAGGRVWHAGGSSWSGADDSNDWLNRG